MCRGWNRLRLYAIVLTTLYHTGCVVHYSEKKEDAGEERATERDTHTDEGSPTDTDTDTNTDPGTDPSTDPGTDPSTDTHMDTACRPDVCANDAYCTDDGEVACEDECGALLILETCISSDKNGACIYGKCGCIEGFGGDDCQTCVVTNNGVEACDLIDNNCDGTTDEGFDLATDPAHCGACNNDCLTSPGLWPEFGQEVPKNMSAAACREGRCEVLTCEPGYKDDQVFPYKDCEFYIKQLAAGQYHTCALLSDSTIRCWGDNRDLQLGIEGESSSTPVTVKGLNLPTDITVESIDAGIRHTCALLSDSTIRCWGGNSALQLGVEGGNSWTSVVVQGLNLPAGATVQSIAMGGSFSCALLSDSTLRCWGSNETLALGFEGGGSTAMPVTIDLGASVESIDAGHRHACALLSDGTVQCWGTLYDINDEYIETATPVSMDIGAPAREIAVGGRYTCALRSDNTVWCWGSNSDHVLGDEGTDITQPVAVQGLTLDVGVTIQHLVSGIAFSCVLLSDGSLRCWGSNGYGQLGFEGDSTAAIPVVVDPGDAILSIAANYHHACVLLPDVSVKCWGRNNRGQLGSTLSDDVDSTHVPTLVEGL